ncbi:MAG TPA: ATP-binding protein, partial [Brumimicrobium sp.]|nr:ATP-binding protein [Brumimicrobium sp.]
YGFATDYFKINKQTVIFTGLNIEKFSDRKKAQKNLTKKDFSPRITIEHYSETKQNFIEFIKANSELAQTLTDYSDAKNDIEENKEILDNTFHELRKLNMQLKRQSEKLNFEIDKHNPSYQNIKYLGLNIFATSRLISTRLNTYDFGLNPELISNTAKKPTKVFKKVEKVTHCLKIQSDEEKVRIQLEGNSYNSIVANDVFELLPFLLLENAIKYSPQNEQVTVKFFENDDNLTIRIRNLGPRPEPEEIPKLTERGIRSKNVNGESGYGLGLYLANFIADLNGIDFNITVDKEIKYISGIKYSDFIVDLKFKNMIVNEHE